MTPEVEIEQLREVPELVGRILAGRGMAAEEMKRFLWPEYARDMNDPFLMTDMAAAVERIGLAAERGEQVVIYGDYDIDGITASAVMIEGLRALGLEAESYIPDRFEEGYGINLEALQGLKARGVNLVVSVDCGITSVAEAAWARDNGLDLVITDHHAVPEVIPEAIAAVNPKRPGDAYPFKELCGAGVAFKLVQALQVRTGKPAAGQEKWLLDLVALGTVCDVVPLVGENRMLAAYGLKVMRKTRREGLRALAEVAGVRIEQITSENLGFALGPRMNAAGRLEHARHSLELMLTQDPMRAAEIARELDDLNRKRRATQEAIYEAADKLAEGYSGDGVLVLADKDWSQGVVGIVASKLMEKWQKPVLIAQVLGEYAKGSARSVKGYSIVEALRANSGLLERFGGHVFAAGFTLKTDRLEEFRAGINEHFAGQAELIEAAAEEEKADLEMDDLDPVDWGLLAELDLLEPFGSGNSRPLIEVRGLRVNRLSRVGAEGKHLRLGLVDARGKHLACIGFGLGTRYNELSEQDVVGVRGSLNKNVYQENTSLQLMVKEILM
jgi:single-stranded-DNA-specific exonuclease